MRNSTLPPSFLGAGASTHEMISWLRIFFRLGQPADAGEHGEKTAAAWLVRERDFVIVARNWRNPGDRREEIDLVCRDGGVLVFVEVKARSAGALVPGYYAVDARKKRVLRRAIEAYLARLREKPRTFRFDVVEVSATRNDALGPAAASLPQRPARGPAAGLPGLEVRHFENVPLFPKHFRA